MGNVMNAGKMNGGNLTEELAQYQLKDGRWRVYVKPYTAEVKEELEAHLKSKRANEVLSISKKDGTYCITSREIFRDFRDLRTSLWFMIFWRFRCEARNTFAMTVEGNNARKLKWCENVVNMPYNEENKESAFYVVTLSHEFIEATCLPRFYNPVCA